MTLQFLILMFSFWICNMNTCIVLAIRTKVLLLIPATSGHVRSYLLQQQILMTCPSSSNKKAYSNLYIYLRNVILIRVSDSKNQWEIYTAIFWVLIVGHKLPANCAQPVHTVRLIEFMSVLWGKIAVHYTKLFLSKLK
jgi:hypothetical protein